MRDYNLRFFKNRWQNDIFSMESNVLDNYKEISGCYILGSADGTDFIYPWGRSPIFYIGTSKNLLTRVNAHIKWIKRAKKEHHSQYFMPHHQYGAAFGTDIAIYKSNVGADASKLEAELITDFYHIYGSIPVGNGAWPREMKKPLGTRIT